LSEQNVSRRIERGNKIALKRGEKEGFLPLIGGKNNPGKTLQWKEERCPSYRLMQKSGLLGKLKRGMFKQGGVGEGRGLWGKSFSWESK